MKKITVFHGINSAPKYYPFEITNRILIPFNLIFEGKVSLDWITNLKQKRPDLKLMIDSGAARYFLNTHTGYPKNYLPNYLSFLNAVGAKFAFALDFCFEYEPFRNFAMLKQNFNSQYLSISKANELGVELYPVIQGWNRESYLESAKKIKTFIKEFDLNFFGVGSVCRATKNKIIKVLSVISKEVDLSSAHAFGQTQRTMPILKRFGFKSLDTSNASSNAGFRCYCDPFGTWFYGLNSPMSPKHFLERKFVLPSERKLFYEFLFKLNYESLELASMPSVPSDWVHPVRKTLDKFLFKRITNTAMN